MGRIRSLKPEFGHSEKLSAEHSEVHLLAGLLLTYADDEGYFNANPKLVHAACCPLRELFVSIPEILVRLTAIGYIEIIKGPENREYGRVINFLIHQRVAHPTPSKIRPLVNPPENFMKSTDTFSPDLGTGNREMEQGREGLDGQVHEIASLYPRIDDAFNLPQDIAYAIAEAIARDGRDPVWVGTKSVSEATAGWPTHELKFLPSPQKFFRESNYRKPPEFWERTGNGHAKPSASAARAERSKENILKGIAADVSRRTASNGA